MIKTYRCKDTEALARGDSPRRFRSFQASAERKLQMLDVARTLDDLRVLPGNRLEKLASDREGSWSIRVNDQWRLCFRFADGHAYEVEIVDHH